MKDIFYTKFSRLCISYYSNNLQRFKPISTQNKANENWHL